MFIGALISCILSGWYFAVSTRKKYVENAKSCESILGALGIAAIIFVVVESSSEVSDDPVLTVFDFGLTVLFVGLGFLFLVGARARQAAAYVTPLSRTLGESRRWVRVASRILGASALVVPLATLVAILTTGSAKWSYLLLSLVPAIVVFPIAWYVGRGIDREHDRGPD